MAARVRSAAEGVTCHKGVRTARTSAIAIAATSCVFKGEAFANDRFQVIGVEEPGLNESAFAANTSFARTEKVTRWGETIPSFQ